MKLTKFGTALALLAIFWAPISLSAKAKNECAPPYQPLKISSSAFSEGQPIPRFYTADGSDVSPPLLWKNVPKHAKKLVLVCEDPDAPGGTFIHWVIYDLLPQSQGLTEGIDKTWDLGDGSRQGVNSFGKVGYNGPSPPAGKPHRYFFKLYAVDQRLHLPARATVDQVMCTIQGHVMDEAKLMGTYSRP